ncbi:hypothetical protein BBP40_010223 [Aspergillus hancockii]|nr:hypothetical protein BBP40_010223 [Aspergillus hancockii]
MPPKRASRLTHQGEKQYYIEIEWTNYRDKNSYVTEGEKRRAFLLDSIIILSRLYNQHLEQGKIDTVVLKREGIDVRITTVDNSRKKNVANATLDFHKARPNVEYKYVKKLEEALKAEWQTRKVYSSIEYSVSPASKKSSSSGKSPLSGESSSYKETSSSGELPAPDSDSPSNWY